MYKLLCLFLALEKEFTDQQTADQAADDGTAKSDQNLDRIIERKGCQEAGDGGSGAGRIVEDTQLCRPGELIALGALFFVAFLRVR